MTDETKNEEVIPDAVRIVLGTVVMAIRNVKLYPPNNPVYAQSIKKSYQALETHMEEYPDYVVGIQKTCFTYHRIPMDVEGPMHRAVASELFAKGVRELAFTSGLTGDELLKFYTVLTLSAEEMAQKNGIASILRDRGISNVRVTEAGLNDVVTGKPEDPAAPDSSQPEAAQEGPPDAGRTLVMSDIVEDPARFGAGMVELAKQTKAGHERVEDRLYDLYRETGSTIQQEQPEKSEELFDGLAKSALSLASPYREGLIGGKLYGDLDAEIGEGKEQDADQHLPTAMHEIQTGRFSEKWTVQEVSTLLKKSSAKKNTPQSTAQAAFPVVPESVPIPRDLEALVHELSEYTASEMAELKALSEAGKETDVMAASLRTLINLLIQVKNPQRSGQAEKDFVHFAGVIHQLEEMLTLLLQKKNYTLATTIINAFHLPVDPAFRARISEALRRTATKPGIVALVSDLRKFGKNAPEGRAAYAYLIAIEREATRVLLELLAEEEDRHLRMFVLDLVKDLGRNQISLIGEHLSDERWYFVRNIVNILGENKTDQSIAFLRKAADHDDVRIRQEVIKGILSIGGKKVVGVLAKFLRDKNPDIQATAVRAFSDLQGIGPDEAAPLIAFLEDRPLLRKEQELTLEAIKITGKIGGIDAVDFLKRFMRVRWWKPRKLQLERKEAAMKASEEIMRRAGDVRRAKR